MAAAYGSNYKSVMVLGIGSVWPSHQQVTLWCNGLHSRLLSGGPKFDSHRGRVVTIHYIILNRQVFWTGTKAVIMFDATSDLVGFEPTLFEEIVCQLYRKLKVSEPKRPNSLRI